MPKIQQRDFYFGAALSMFLKHNIDSRPSMIEETKDSSTQILKMCTDTSRDFYIYMKYTTDCRLTKTEDLISWSFNFSSSDKSLIDSKIAENIPVYMFLICGIQSENSGEIAVLTPKEYQLIKHRNSITINLKGKRPQTFAVHIGKSRSDVIRVPRNSIMKHFQVH